MLGIITTKSSVAVQPVDSQIQLGVSTEYIINASNIIKMEVIDTNDSLIRYKLNKREDRSPDFILIANETNAAIQTIADVTPSSKMIPLPVFAGAYAFSDSTGTTTTKYFNVEDISWVEENADATLCKMWVEEGGFGLKSFFVNYNLSQFMDILTTGTSTTTTSSTSSTSSTTTSA